MHNTYSVEFKIAVVEEFFARNISYRKFVDEKGLKLPTFCVWVKKYKAANGTTPTIYKRNDKLIDIKDEVKAFMPELTENSRENATFVMEVNNLKFTFNINNLKEVLEVIKNDWTK